MKQRKTKFERLSVPEKLEHLMKMLAPQGELRRKFEDTISEAEDLEGTNADVEEFREGLAAEVEELRAVADRLESL